MTFRSSKLINTLWGFIVFVVNLNHKWKQCRDINKPLILLVCYCYGYLIYCHLALISLTVLWCVEVTGAFVFLSNVHCQSGWGRNVIIYMRKKVKRVGWAITEVHTALTYYSELRARHSNSCICTCKCSSQSYWFSGSTHESRPYSKMVKRWFLQLN